MSLLFLGLYAWARFIPVEYSFNAGLMISDATVIVAIVACIASIVISIWLPEKHLALAASVIYLMGATLIGTLISTSGSITSPFLGTWPIIALFASFFGSGVAIGMALIVVVFVFISYGVQSIALPVFVGYLVFGIAPIVLGLILWYRRQPSTKKADTSLRDLANKLSSIEGKSDIVINSIDDGVISVNRNNIIDLINPAAEALLGWHSGDALGLDWRSVFKLVDGEGREVLEHNHPITQSLLGTHPIHNDDLHLITHNEKRRSISIVSSPVGQHGTGAVIVFRDITKEKAAEREQAEFISTASHEMRTPVASIEGYLGLALNPATATIDNKARDYITKAHQSAKHLGELFQNLLDISKAEDGRLKSSPEVIDVVAMLGDIFEGLEPLAREKGLRYIYKPNPSLDDAHGGERKLQPVFYSHVDPAHLREVVMNLIENAIKYTPRGDVTIDVTGDDTYVTISVKDSGIGIPTEDISHLFQKFYRVDNTDTREIGGTGLGLYLCRKLAEAMGGNIRVESVYQQGSTFFLDIPRTTYEDAMRKISEAAEAQPAIIHDEGHTALVQQAIPAPAPLQLGDAYAPVSTPPPSLPLQSTLEHEAPSASEPTHSSRAPGQHQSLRLQNMTLNDIDIAVRSRSSFDVSERPSTTTETPSIAPRN